MEEEKRIKMMYKLGRKCIMVEKKHFTYFSQNLKYGEIGHESCIAFKCTQILSKLFAFN